MSRMSPAHRPQPVRLKFTFKLATEWVEEHVVQHGTRPSDTYEFEINLTELDDPDLRRRFLTVHQAQDALPSPTPLDAPTDDVPELLERLEAWDFIAGPPTTDPFASRMKTWIDKHGSERLKLAHARGYKVNATYARERAVAEYPTFWVDTSDSARWRERTDPSAAALQAETEASDAIAERGDEEMLNARIVWLTAPPDDLARWCTMNSKVFSAGEAVLVAPYLGRYSLLRPLAFPRKAP